MISAVNSHAPLRRLKTEGLLPGARPNCDAAVSGFVTKGGV